MHTLAPRILISVCVYLCSTIHFTLPHLMGFWLNIQCQQSQQITILNLDVNFWRTLTLTLTHTRTHTITHTQPNIVNTDTDTHTHTHAITHTQPTISDLPVPQRSPGSNRNGWPEQLHPAVCLLYLSLSWPGYLRAGYLCMSRPRWGECEYCITAICRSLRWGFSHHLPPLPPLSPPSPVSSLPPISRFWSYFKCHIHISGNFEFSHTKKFVE